MTVRIRRVTLVFSAVCAAALPAGHVAGGTAQAGPWAKVAAPSESGKHMDAETATLLSDGRVLAAGSPPAIFDPASGRWTAAAPTLFETASPKLTPLSDGRVLATGNMINAQDPANRFTPKVELFDPKTGAWTAAPAMSAVRFAETVTLLEDGRVLAAGGLTPGSEANPGLRPTESTEIYDPSSGQWSQGAPMPLARADHTASRLSDTTVLFTGGRPGELDASLNDALLFDSAKGEWKPVGRLMKSRRAGHSATVLPDGRVLITGGTALLSGPGRARSILGLEKALLKSTEVYDPASGAFKPAAPLRYGRQAHAATVTSEGSVLAVGGHGDQPDASITPAELYQPGKDRWVPLPGSPLDEFAGSQTQPGRVAFGAVLLEGKRCGSNCGKVLVLASGQKGSGAALWTGADAVESRTTDEKARPFPLVPVAIAVAVVAGAGLFVLLRKVRAAR